MRIDLTSLRALQPLKQQNNSASTRAFRVTQVYRASNWIRSCLGVTTLRRSLILREFAFSRPKAHHFGGGPFAHRSNYATKRIVVRLQNRRSPPPKSRECLSKTLPR